MAAAAQRIWPQNVSFIGLIDRYVPVDERVRHAINIGARDGKANDPVYELHKQLRYGGTAVEGDPSVRKALHHNLREVNQSGAIHISWGFVTPATILPRLLAEGAPLSPDALKIDIDSFDADVLAAILGSLKPKTLMIEFNPDYPPPIRWQQAFDERFNFNAFDYKKSKGRKADRGFYGASADAVFAIASAKDYALVSFELGWDGRCYACEHNMWFVHAHLFSRVETKPKPTWKHMTRMFWAAHHAYVTASPFRLERNPPPNLDVPHCWVLQDPCPLVEVLNVARGLHLDGLGIAVGVRNPSFSIDGTGAWVNASVALRKHADKSSSVAEWAASTAAHARDIACGSGGASADVCPYNVSISDHTV